jgi:hypothetical protein
MSRILSSITYFSSILFLAESALTFHQVISVSRGSTIRDLRLRILPTHLDPWPSEPGAFAGTWGFRSAAFQAASLALRFVVFALAGAPPLVLLSALARGPEKSGGSL